MSDVQRTYLPAAGHHWSLPLYDPLVKLLGGDAARRVLVNQSRLQPGHRVLEVGCGTGSLLVQIARAEPRAEVTGLDPDPMALARAKRKTSAAPVAIRLDRGFSDALPYPDATFDRVFSCFMWHHLNDVEQKKRTMREIRRVLRPGGQLHLLDFARPESHAMSIAARWLHSSDHLKDNSEARILAFMNEAGLMDASTVSRGAMFYVLRLAYYQASAPQP
jgi:ubiquinone/menaquinone biosynthesis C-methylase UbiE